MPKIGDLLFVKSTEEPTMFHQEVKLNWLDRLLNEFPRSTPVVYRVRRPIVSTNGAVNYQIEDFLPEELESESDQTARLYAKFKQRQAMALGEVGPTDGPLSKPHLV